MLYVLDQEARVLPHFANALASHYAATAHKEKRQWFPEVLVVGVVAAATSRRPTASELLRFLETIVVGYVQNNYRTKPYAAARALCGVSAAASEAVQQALRTDAAKQFRFFLVGALLPGSTVQTLSLYKVLPGSPSTGEPASVVTLFFFKVFQ